MYILRVLPRPSVPRNTPTAHPDPAHSRDPLVSAQAPRSDLGAPQSPHPRSPLGDSAPAHRSPPLLISASCSPHSRRDPICGIPSPSPPSNNADHQPPVLDPRFLALRRAAPLSPVLSSVRSDASRQPEILREPLGKSPTLSGPQLPVCKMGIIVPVS